MKKKVLIAACLLSTLVTRAQPVDENTEDKKSIVPVLLFTAASDAAALTLLSEAWYKNQPRSSFHFFDDSGEWKQMDKAGHVFSSFHAAHGAIKVLKSHGLKNKSCFWGSVAGFLLISQIEALDGFSSDYGASASDLAANGLGSLLVYSQYALWDDLRLRPKYSFHRSAYAAKRPEVLGEKIGEEALKDYNGQTYWLSVDVDKLAPALKTFPKWLNIGLGYGAENIILARDRENGYRQYYLSLDIDLSEIKSRKGWINFLLFGFNMIHLPAPALELNKNGMDFHWLYF